MRQIKFICKSNPESIVDSILPIITKCDPNDDEIDLDDIRTSVFQTLKNSIANQYEMYLQDKLYKNERKEFLETYAIKLSGKFEIYDPLEREIIGINED